MGKNAHDGLYNALTCNYEDNIQILELSLNTKTIERNQLFHNYQQLIAKTTHKEEIIHELNQEISTITNSITNIQKLLVTVQNSKVQALSILKLKTKLKQLNLDILNKSTFFDVEDALFTNQKLVVKSDTQKYAKAYHQNLLKDKAYKESYSKDLLEDKAYAEAYNKNLLKDKKYAQAYTKNLLENKAYAQAYKLSPNSTFEKAYKKDIEKDKKIRLTFSAQIEKVQSSLTNDNLSNSINTISSLIKNIKIYTNSITKS